MNNSRLDKYSDDKKMSRVTRNEELYKEIKDSELDGYNIRSNATVIGNQEPEIDIEKIKKILDTKYNEAPKRKSIRVEPKHEENSIIDDVPTKEYDLNIILEKAKDEKPETYEEARAKKLRNTQYDILNNLNIGDNDEDYSVENNIEKPEINKAEEDLMELINTITINEAKVKEEAIKNEKDEVDPLNILEDLKGSGDTAVYDKIEDIPTPKVEEDKKEESKVPENTLDDSFYTKSLFKKKDFEDGSQDFLDDNKMGIGVKILIALVIIIFAAGLFLFLKSFLNF